MTSTAKSSKKTKANYHHGDLRTALVVAATDILSEKGVDKLSLRGVARQAGVSQAAPYHHFENKHALLSAVAAAGFEGLRASMLKHAAENTEDEFQGIGVGYVMFAFNNPALFRLMQGPYFTCEEPLADLVAAAEQSRSVLIQGIAEAYPDATEQEVKVKAAASWSIVHGLATLLLDGRMQAMFDEPTDVKEIAKSVTELLNV